MIHAFHPCLIHSGCRHRRRRQYQTSCRQNRRPPEAVMVSAASAVFSRCCKISSTLASRSSDTAICSCSAIYIIFYLKSLCISCSFPLLQHCPQLLFRPMQTGFHCALPTFQDPADLRDCAPLIVKQNDYIPIPAVQLYHRIPQLMMLIVEFRRQVLFPFHRTGALVLPIDFFASLAAICRIQLRKLSAFSMCLISHKHAR